MDVQITGKGLDLGTALQTHVSDRLETGVHKYFDRPAEAQVTFSREGPEIQCETTAHLASGVFLAAQGTAHDAYSAFDEALTKLEKRVRRYKRRLKNHHADNKAALPAQEASAYVLEPFGADTDDDSPLPEAPVVIAEQKTALRRMTVGDAVLQLDLVEAPVIVFRDAAKGHVNVVYRREDGNVGWIDSAEGS